MLRKLILNNVKTCVRADDLLKVCRGAGYDYLDIIGEIKSLVFEGDLVEVSYSTPGQRGDKCGIFFPKGTEFFETLS